MDVAATIEGRPRVGDARAIGGDADILVVIVADSGPGRHRTKPGPIRVHGEDPGCWIARLETLAAEDDLLAVGWKP
jgi:hypothetical protein